MGFSDMNLFPDIDRQDLSPQLAEIHVERGVFRGLGISCPTAMFAPMHYEPGYAYPLILWLHTPGTNESQLLRVMPTISLRNYVAVAVRGTRSLGWNGLPLPGYYWDAEACDHAMTAVMDALDVAHQKYHIDPRRVFIVGSEGGGTMALRIALRNPTFFRGVASLDGAMPEDTVLLERLRDVQKLAFLFAVSRHSQTCPVEPLCEHLRLFHAAGLQIALRNYPTAGSLQTDMLRDIDRWIMDNIETSMR